eukprot:5123469-Pyramimonas_sp.AAC.1
MLAGPKVGERWEQVGSWTQGEKRKRGAMGVESTLAVIGTGGSVKRSSVILTMDQSDAGHGVVGPYA